MHSIAYLFLAGPCDEHIPQLHKSECDRHIHPNDEKWAMRIQFEKKSWFLKKKRSYRNVRTKVHWSESITIYIIKIQHNYVVVEAFLCDGCKE